jgi:hypothetical protein
MPVAGPLQVPPPVGGGEAHPAGPGAPTYVDREVFSSNEFFSMITSRVFSLQHPSPSPFVPSPSPSKKKMGKKKILENKKPVPETFFPWPSPFFILL